MKQFGLYLTEPQLDILKGRAEAEDTSVADLIRFAINQYIMPSDMRANKARKQKSWEKFRNDKTSYQGFVDQEITFRETFYAGYNAGWTNFQTRHIAEIIEE